MIHLIVLFVIFNLFCELKASTSGSLTHYWPIRDGTMNDAVSTAHMTQGAKTRFTADRFGCANQALDLNGGYTQVPSGVYFETPQFSISVWIYPMNVGSWARVIDFGDGGYNNIVFAIQNSFNSCPVLQIFYPGFLSITSKIEVDSNTPLKMSQWQLLTLTFDGTNFIMYINAVQSVKLKNAYSMTTVSRSSNYIGKSYFTGNLIHIADGVSYSYLDDLRFFSSCLTKNDVLSLMNENSSICMTTSYTETPFTQDITSATNEDSTMASANEYSTTTLSSTSLLPVSCKKLVFSDHFKTYNNQKLNLKSPNFCE